MIDVDHNKNVKTHYSEWQIETMFLLNLVL
ncbi:hypothetical protein JGUZn3_11080 [Entomobacter blattae]|uniref:Uncharacterized protein n=1 Tax=Entomobacter blattae TaxID=2762277 RepID=A0A7H1NRC5_9PROT|nr:hypothetical protein JGUZn3_11080 [Entomobacter blattae]